MTGQDTPLWSDNPTSRDLLGFSDIADSLIDALKREKLDPLALGVFGDWGSGKTSILEITQATLAAEETVIVIFTHPWEYDPKTDPKATLISEVLTAIEERAKAQEDWTEKLGEGFKALKDRVNWSKAVSLVANTAVTLSIPSIDKIVDVFSKEGSGGEPTLQGFREEFSKLMGDLSGIDRVVVLVDDLDRCLPSTVVASLEAIKLFLAVPKMGFVLAADRRLVELAIAERFGASAQAHVMAQEYLEKIIQIPITVPALGLGDTEAYLAMLVVERHLPADGVKLAQLVAHFDERRRAAHPKILDALPNGLMPATADPDLALAGMLAPVLYERLRGNPRRLKRFLNAFWVRSAIAERRGAALEPTALAKLMVLEQLAPDAFGQVLDWLGDGTLGEKLRALEEDHQAPNGAHAAFEWWGRMAPPLASVDLGPYLRLAASLRSRTGPRSDLRADLREVLDQLHAGTMSARNEGRKHLGELASADKLVMAREITELMRIEPGTQEYLSEAIGQLIIDPALTAELIDGLRQLDPSRVDAGLIIAMTGENAPNDQTHPVVRQWLDSGRMGEVQGKAAKAVLDGDQN